MWLFESKERLGTTYVPRHGVHQWSRCSIRARVNNIAVSLHNYKFPRLVIVQSVWLNCSVLPSTWKPVYWNWLTHLLFVRFTCSCYSDWNATVTLHLEATWRFGLSRVAPCTQDTQHKTWKKFYTYQAYCRRGLSFRWTDCTISRAMWNESFFWQAILLL